MTGGGDTCGSGDRSVALRWREAVCPPLSWSRGPWGPPVLVGVGGRSQPSQGPHRYTSPRETPEDACRSPQSLHELEGQMLEGICATLYKQAIASGCVATAEIPLGMAIGGSGWVLPPRTDWGLQPLPCELLQLPAPRPMGAGPHLSLMDAT